MTQPLSGASTPDKQDGEGLDNQQRSQVRRPVLPAPADMFSNNMTQHSGLETPERLYPSGANTQPDQDTVPLKLTTGVSQVSYHLGGSVAASGGGTMDALAPANMGQQPVNYRADTSADRQQLQQEKDGARTTLVPNFRSISPSIFNIDLNQTVVKHSETTPDNNAPGQQMMAGSSPQRSNGSNRNQIYVSIHQSNKRQTENITEMGGIISNRGALNNSSGANYASQGMRVRRIGPLQNKGDKIKFGVLVSRETKRKQKQQSVDFLEPHEIFETPKALMHQGRVAIGKHSDHVNRIIDQYRTYTTTKTMPTILVNRHTNVIKQFNKNFTRETDTYSRQSYYTASRMGGPAQSTTVDGGAGGYYSDTQSLQTKLNSLNRGNTLTAARMSKKSFWSDDKNLMSIRDVIEEHARSVAAIKKSFRPNVHFEIDEQRRKRNRELEERGRKLAKELNVSPHSCCTRTSRFYRSLTTEQPIRQHNKPLTHLMRPNQKLIIERQQRAADEKQKRQQLEKHQLKRGMMKMRLGMSSMHSDLKGGIATVQRGTQLRKHTLVAMKEETERYKNRMRAKRSKDDWEQERKDIELSIDNGMTFSHLSRRYPMKREWAKYLVLLKAKEKGRRLKERKVREVLEDLHERGVRDQKQIAHELDLFEYQEFKKKRDRNKARMGAKAEAKYYRPVDTDRTLEIHPISMDLTDDYDDGPGGFKIEDFEGVETMFSKQSLEQRKLRVDRARERLREKRLKKLADQNLLQEPQMQMKKDKPPGTFMPPLMGKSLEKAISINEFGPPKAVQVQSPMIFQNTNMRMQENPMPNINVDDQRDAAYPKRRRHGGKPPLGIGLRTPPIATKGYNNHQQDQSGEAETPDVALETLHSVNDPTGKNGSDDRDNDGIRVLIASPSGTAIQGRKDTINTASQIREYSLEDGGIFEKKTLQNDASVEQLKMMGSSATHPSYEMLPGQKPTQDISVDQIQEGIRSEKQLVKMLDGNSTIKSRRRTATPHEDGGLVDNTTEMLDQDENATEMGADISGVVMPMTTTGVHKINEFLPKTRPSTTENIRRSIVNRKRRQLMSGQTKEEQVRISVPDGVVAQKSVGVFTTVQYKAHMLQQQRVTHEGITSTNLGTEERPSGALLSGSGMRKNVKTTVRDSDILQGQRNPMNFSGFAGQTDTTYSKAQIGQLARKNTLDNCWRSEHKKIIWKEVMKQKEESGEQTISRQLVRSIRNKIRRQRRKRAQNMRQSDLSQNFGGSKSFTTHQVQGQSKRYRMGDKINSPSMGRTETEEPRTASSKDQMMSNVRQSSSIEAHGGSQDRIKNIQNNAMIAQKGQYHPAVPQILMVQGQPCTGLTAYTSQQNAGDQTFFMGPTNNNAPIISGDGGSVTAGAMSYGDQASSIEVMQNTATAAMANRIVLGGNPAALGNKEVSYQSLNPADYNKLQNFVEINRSCVRENSLKIRLGSNLSRLPKMRNKQPDSKYQMHLQENMTRSAMGFNQKTNLGLRTRHMRYPMSVQRMRAQQLKQANANTYATLNNTTARMYPAFQDQLMDKRSMQVFRQNELTVDPEIDNEFSRQQVWNETLNCPYYGLMSLRMTQDKPINSISRVENILKPFTTGNKQDRMHIRKVKSAINHRNKLREMDKRVYKLIEACQDSKKIHWKQIYDQNEEFRDSQRKKIQGEPEAPSFDDYEDLLGFLEMSKRASDNM